MHVVTHTAPGAPARVVIIHGAMDRATSFAKVARRLADLDVVRYDRRGYAGSIALGAAPLATHIADALDVLAGVPSILVGHSLGGLVALGVASQQPAHVEALVLYETPTPWAPWWPNRSPVDTARGAAVDPGDVAEHFMRRMVGDRLWERLPPSTRAQRRAEGPALIEDLRAARRPVPFDPGSISTPAVVAHGSATDERHRMATLELASTLPEAALVVIDGAQHGAHLTHPGPFADLVRRAAVTVRS